MNPFKIFSLLTSFLCLCLFTWFILLPEAFSPKIEEARMSLFLLRRGAVFLLGICLLLFFSRNIPCSQARRAISLSMAITWIGLSITGLIEFFGGYEKQDVLVSVVIEIIVSVSYFSFWISDGKRLSGQNN